MNIPIDSLATGPLTEEESGLLPSEEDVVFYRKHGYYHSRKLFTDEEIEAAIAGSERYYAGERDFPPPNGFETDGWKPGDGEGLRKNDYASLRNRELTALVRKPILAAVAARLAGAGIRLWHDQLLYKPVSTPGSPVSVGWHTDRQYWRCCTSDNMLTAWIPFHDCGEEMGTLTVVDGSHTWPDNTRGLDFFSSDLEGMERRFDTGGAAVTKVPMILAIGHVSFHHCRTIHGSGPNFGTAPRRAIAVHLQDQPNRYREYRFSDGNLARHENNRMCRQVDGRPDYTDPVICPRLWPVSA